MEEQKDVAEGEAARKRMTRKQKPKKNGETGKLGDGREGNRGRKR